LRFDRFTFPASSHDFRLPHFEIASSNRNSSG
jgi:hypothetical protein